MSNRKKEENGERRKEGTREKGEAGCFAPREAWKLAAAWVLRPELPLAAHLVSCPVVGGSGGRGRAQVMSMTNCLQS